MTDDLKLKSVEELTQRIVDGVSLRGYFACGMSGDEHADYSSAECAWIELASRASQLSALREALEWFGDSQVSDGGLPPFSELYDIETEPTTAYTRERGEDYVAFLLRVHQAVLASQTNTPSQ